MYIYKENKNTNWNTKIKKCFNKSFTLTRLGLISYIYVYNNAFTLHGYYYFLFTANMLYSNNSAATITSQRVFIQNSSKILYVRSKFQIHYMVHEIPLDCFFFLLLYKIYTITGVCLFLVYAVYYVVVRYTTTNYKCFIYCWYMYIFENKSQVRFPFANCSVYYHYRD